MKKLRAGIIGAGSIARTAHLPAYKSLKDRVEVVAIADLNLERAEEAAKEFGIPDVYNSVEELLVKTDVDYIDICVWNGSHAPVAIAAANAGKAILCEKPMSDCLDHSLQMAEVIKKTGVPFMMAMVSRFSAEAMLLHGMVEAGEFGDVYYAKTGYVRRRGTPIGWFTDKSKSGGGPVIDIGVHVLDSTWFLMGRPKPVRVSGAVSYGIGNFATKGIKRWEALDTGNNVFDTEDSASAIIHFENGASLLLEASWAMNTPESRYTQICGTKAGAILDPFTIFTENALGYLTDNHPVVRQVNRFEQEIGHFIDCMNTGKKPISPIEDGIAVQRMLQGLYDSARLGKEIVL